MPSKTFHISGCVIHRQTRLGIANLRVEAWDKNLIVDDLIGCAVTDARGSFQITFDQSYFRKLFMDRRSDLFLKIFRGEELIHCTEVLWDTKSHDMSMVIEVTLLDDETSVDQPIVNQLTTAQPTVDQPIYQVKGTVRLADGLPAYGVTVSAFDRDLRNEQLLGQAQTDRTGYYEITYTTTQFQQAEKNSADLMVRVFDAKGELQATSPTVFNAQPVETIDLMVGGGEYQGPSEYERFMEELRPLLGRQSLANLREDTVENPQAGQFRDISFLSGETGINPQYISFLVIAAQLGNKTDLPPAVFYGFFRQDLPTNLPVLLAQGPAVQRRTLEIALQNNIIPIGLKNELDKILRRLEALPIQQPVFFVKPEVLFSNLTDLSHLDEEESGFIVSKLKDSLRREILNLVGIVSEAMTHALQNFMTKIDYRRVEEVELSNLLKETILPEIKRDKKLAKEAAEIENRLTNIPSKKVHDLLYLGVPIKENPLFNADVRRAKTVAYAELAGLNDEVAKKLVVRDMSLDDMDEIVLADLIKEGILTEQQKTTLQLTTDLGRLTGDHLPLVGMLRDREISSVADFIDWEQTDWQQFITERKITLPPGETAATYAENIQFNIEKTYSSQFLFSRVLNPRSTSRFNLLDSLHPLLKNNDRLIDGNNPAEIDWQKIGDENHEQLQMDLQNLTVFANTYRHLDFAKVINDRTVDPEQKKATINARLQSLDKFYRSNPTLDLRQANFFETQTKTL